MNDGLTAEVLEGCLASASDTSDHFIAGALATAGGDVLAGAVGAVIVEGADLQLVAFCSQSKVLGYAFFFYSVETNSNEFLMFTDGLKEGCTYITDSGLTVGDLCSRSQNSAGHESPAGVKPLTLPAESGPWFCSDVMSAVSAAGLPGDVCVYVVGAFAGGIWEAQQKTPSGLQYVEVVCYEYIYTLAGPVVSEPDLAELDLNVGGDFAPPSTFWRSCRVMATSRDNGTLSESALAAVRVIAEELMRALA